MALSKAATDTLPNQDDKEPNHMIFWLDIGIGDPREYTHLKKAFGSITDPRAGVVTMLRDEDYEDILAVGNAVSVIFEGVVFLLQAFTNINDCLAAFENNQDKRIFFITSGSLGKDAVPIIIERYRHIFTDSITDQPYSSVYVFCGNMEYHMNWIMNDLEYIQGFTFDADLLERLTRDIAEYFIERSKRLREGNHLKSALQRLHWAETLWLRYDKMQQRIITDKLQEVRETKRMKEIKQFIQDIHSELPQKLPDEKDNDEDTDSDDSTKGYEPS